MTGSYEAPITSAEALARRSAAAAGFRSPSDEQLEAATSAGGLIHQPDEVFGPEDAFTTFVENQAAAAVSVYADTMGIVVGDGPNPLSPEVRRQILKSVLEAAVRDTIRATRNYLTDENHK